jgi:hypothetical protein
MILDSSYGTDTTNHRRDPIWYTYYLPHASEVYTFPAQSLNPTRTRGGGDIGANTEPGVFFFVQVKISCMFDIIPPRENTLISTLSRSM